MNFTEMHHEESCIHSNFSCLSTSPAAADVLLFVCVAVIVTVTVGGNLLVIISICHFKQLQTPTNFLLLSLAMADFLVGVIVMPLYFAILIDPRICLGTVVCAVFNIATFHLTCVSIYNVSLIAVDRCLAVSDPFHYSMKMTVNLTLKIIAILWLYSLFYNLVLLHFNTDITNMKANITCSECVVILNKVWSIVDFILVFLVPCSLIIILYLKIFAIAKRHANKIKSVRKCQKTNIGSMASEKKAAKSLGVLVAVFLMCLVPFYISEFLDAYVSNGSVHVTISITLTLLYLNSSLNPVIYALLYPWFQRSIKLIITLRICNAESSVANVLEQAA